MLEFGENIVLNESLGWQNCTLSADQGTAVAQCNYAVNLEKSEAILMNTSLALHFGVNCRQIRNDLSLTG
jgi:hypothetical protein